MHSAFCFGPFLKGQQASHLTGFVITLVNMTEQTNANTFTHVALGVLPSVPNVLGVSNNKTGSFF